MTFTCYIRFAEKAWKFKRAEKNAKLKMLYKNFVTRICDSIHLMVTQIAIYDLLVFNWLWIASVVRFMPFLFFSVLWFVFFCSIFVLFLFFRHFFPFFNRYSFHEPTLNESWNMNSRRYITINIDVRCI